MPVSPSIVQQGKLISQLVDENVPVCVSAGNDGKEAKLDVWPSCFHDPVCVAAINDNAQKPISVHGTTRWMLLMLAYLLRD